MDGFSNCFGVIAATAGSAIGLGIIWHFPYVIGENGFVAFLLIYLLIILILGIPMMVAELCLGRMAGRISDCYSEQFGFHENIA